MLPFFRVVLFHFLPLSALYWCRIDERNVKLKQAAITQRRKSERTF